MAKRSVNFTGRKPMKASHIVSIAEWLGMSNDEIKAMAEDLKKRITDQQHAAEQRKEREG